MNEILESLIQQQYRNKLNIISLAEKEANKPYSSIKNIVLNLVIDSVEQVVRMFYVNTFLLKACVYGMKKTASSVESLTGAVNNRVSDNLNFSREMDQNFDMMIENINNNNRTISDNNEKIFRALSMILSS